MENTEVRELNRKTEFLASQLEGLIRNIKPSLGGSAAAYSLISEADEADRPRLLEKYLKEVKLVTAVEERQTLPEAGKHLVFVDFTRKYMEPFHRMLGDMIAKKPSEEEFYAELWKIIDSGFFGEEEKSCLIFLLTDDKRMPYYRVEVRSSENCPEPGELCDLMLKHVNGATGRIKYLLCVQDNPFARGEAIAKIISGIEDEKEKLAVLTWCIDFFDKTSDVMDFYSVWSFRNHLLVPPLDLDELENDIDGLDDADDADCFDFSDDIE